MERNVPKKSISRPFFKLGTKMLGSNKQNVGSTYLKTNKQNKQNFELQFKKCILN